MATANDSFSVNDAQILDKFKGLLDVVQGTKARSAMKSAMRSTLTPIQRAVRTGAKKVLPGHQSVAKTGVDLKINRSGLGGRVMITKAYYYPEYGRGVSGKGKLYGLFWWELGTRDGLGRDRNGKGRRFHRGTPAKPFFKPAVESRLGEAGQTLTKAIDRIIQKKAAQK